MHNLSVNARFLGRPPTGVDRVAIELIKALLRSTNVKSITLYHPKLKVCFKDWLFSIPKDLSHKLVIKEVGINKGYLWEQIDLPIAAGRSPLLSLCSTGPIFKRNHYLMIHDAQVWDAPISYSLPFRMAYKSLLPILGRSSKKILTVSRFSSRRLFEVGITRKPNAAVVSNGADHILDVVPDASIFNRKNLIKGNYILAIGNLAPHKNLSRLIEAASKRGPSQHPLVIAGGINSSVFSDAGLKESSNVKFLGRVSDGELRSLYEGALALAFPSITEGFGLPPLEAMLCGCPVLASTGGAIPEVCGDAALYNDPYDIDAWARSLDLIETDTTLREKLIESGKIQASLYTWDMAAQQLLNEII